MKNEGPRYEKTQAPNRLSLALDAQLLSITQWLSLLSLCNTRNPKIIMLFLHQAPNSVIYAAYVVGALTIGSIHGYTVDITLRVRVSK